MLATLNVSAAQIESYLLAGQSVDDIATEWSEPRANVLAVLRRLQQDGRLPGAPASVKAVAPRPPEPTAVRASSSTNLWDRAKATGDKKILAAAAKAQERMAELAAMVEAFEGQSEARAEVQKLERRLAEERAKLQGESRSKRPVAMAACPECGKECRGGTGLSAHRRLAHKVVSA